MNKMRKVSIEREGEDSNKYVLYNDAFYVKQCSGGKIVWTSERKDAHVFTSAIEANLCIEEINRFLSYSG